MNETFLKEDDLGIVREWKADRKSLPNPDSHGPYLEQYPVEFLDIVLL